MTRRLVLSNTYGHPNLGDEAILTAMIDELQVGLPHSTITVLSARPELTRQWHPDVHVVRSHSFRGSKETFKVIRESDLLLIGGGGIIQDQTSLGNLLFHLSRAFMAYVTNTPFVCYGVGVGPLHSRLGRRLTAMILGKAVAITVRDRLSAALLQQIGVPNELVQVTADPAVNIRVGSDDRLPRHLDGVRRKKEQGQPVIGISLRPVIDQYHVLPGPYQANVSTERLVGIVAEAVSKFTKMIDGCLLFYSMHPDQDDPVARLLADRLASGVEMTMVPGKVRPQQMVRALQLCDLLIGMRLHTLILASHSARPLVALSYAPKVRGYMELLGQSDYVLTDDRWFLEPLGVLIESSWHRRATLNAEIARKFAELQTVARRNLDMILLSIDG